MQADAQQDADILFKDYAEGVVSQKDALSNGDIAPGSCQRGL